MTPFYVFRCTLERADMRTRIVLASVAVALLTIAALVDLNASGSRAVPQSTGGNEPPPPPDSDRAWQLYSKIGDALGVQALLPMPDGLTIYAAIRRAGVSVSRDGGKTWKAMNAGLDGADAVRLINTPVGLVVGATGGQSQNRQGVYRWNGTKWVRGNIPFTPGTAIGTTAGVAWDP